MKLIFTLMWPHISMCKSLLMYGYCGEGGNMMFQLNNLIALTTLPGYQNTSNVRREKIANMEALLVGNFWKKSDNPKLIITAHQPQLYWGWRRGCLILCSFPRVSTLSGGGCGGGWSQCPFGLHIFGTYQNLFLQSSIFL